MTELRILVCDDEPAMRVAYTYTNSGRGALKARHMVRNFYIAGGSVGPEDQYFWNGHRGLEEKPWPYATPDGWHDVAR